MKLYIPIKKEVDINVQDRLRSPLGNHYMVVTLNNEDLKLLPIYNFNDHESDLQFVINKHALVMNGWKKLI